MLASSACVVLLLGALYGEADTSLELAADNIVNGVLHVGACYVYFMLTCSVKSAECAVDLQVLGITGGIPLG